MVTQQPRRVGNRHRSKLRSRHNNNIIITCSKPRRQQQPTVLLLLALLSSCMIQFQSCYGMIYLEDIEGAMHYDSLPSYVVVDGDETSTGTYTTVHSSSDDYEEPLNGNVDGDGDGDLEGLPFKVGTPDHYLTWPPTSPAETESIMPTRMPSTEEEGEVAVAVGTAETILPSADDALEDPIGNENNNSNNNHISSSSSSSMPSNTTITDQSNNNAYTFFQEVGLPDPNNDGGNSSKEEEDYSTFINEAGNNTTTQTKNNDATTNSSSTVFDRQRQRRANEENNLSTDIIAPAGEQQQPILASSTTSPPILLLPQHPSSTTSPITAITSPPNTSSSSSTSTSLPTLPTKPPYSIIPEITGEYDDGILHNKNPHHRPNTNSNNDNNNGDNADSTNDNNDDVYNYFNDLHLIEPSPTTTTTTTTTRNKYVYYDSKQARFGVDLGPRGLASFVNLVLPPRFGNNGRDDGDDDGWWDALNQELLKEIEENEEGGSSGVVIKEQVAIIDGIGGDGNVNDVTQVSSTEGGDGTTLGGNTEVLNATADDDATVAGNNTGNTTTLNQTDNSMFNNDTASTVTLATEAASDAAMSSSSEGQDNGDGQRQLMLRNSRRVLFDIDVELGLSDPPKPMEEDASSVGGEDAVAANTYKESSSSNWLSTTSEMIMGEVDQSNNSSTSNIIINDTDATAESEYNTSSLEEEGEADAPQQQYVDDEQQQYESSSAHHVADYFCFHDFRNWMIYQRNNDNFPWRRRATTGNNDADHIMDSIGNGTTANPFDGITNPETTAKINSTANATNLTIADDHHRPPINHTTLHHNNNNNQIHSTRPMTLLVKRGRCSFESKAKLAMALNALFSFFGRSNRIQHLIIYNNGTDDDNNSTTPEKLIDMNREIPVQDGGEEVTVGLLYVATNSGNDLVKRMKEQERDTKISPYLDTSMLFPMDNDNESNQQREEENDSEEEGILIRRRRHLRPDWDGSIKDDGEHPTIGQDPNNGNDHNDGDFHDEDITHGWFFPATLTRFCLSCGSSQNYGFTYPTVSDADSKGDNYSPEGRPNNDDPYPGPPNVRIPGQYGHEGGHYYAKPWLEVIRKLMIAILVLLLVGPVILAAQRWYSVGGTFRVTVDENGNRRVRVVSPNLEVFVNGVPGTVETNGMKLDRAQVFMLPEVEYVGAQLGDAEEDVIVDGNTTNTRIVEREGENDCEEGGSNDSDESLVSEIVEFSRCLTCDSHPPPPHIISTPSNEAFVSSTCCSICLEEFTPGERLRVLPRCDHHFHTECVLPWLTERQGCCPLCKKPVLPEELQRGRGSRRRRGSSTSSRGRRRRRRMFQSLRAESRRHHQPQSTPSTAPTTTERSGAISQEVASGDVGDDLLDTHTPLPQDRPVLVTPDRSEAPTSDPGNATVPFGGGLESPCSLTASVNVEEDLIGLEHGQSTSLPDPSEGSPEDDNNNATSAGDSSNNVIT